MRPATAEVHCHGVMLADSRTPPAHGRNLSTENPYQGLEFLKGAFIPMLSGMVAGEPHRPSAHSERLSTHPPIDVIPDERLADLSDLFLCYFEHRSFSGRERRETIFQNPANSARSGPLQRVVGRGHGRWHYRCA